jgi:predicted MFS family arabinose efflux permease
MARVVTERADPAGIVWAVSAAYTIGVLGGNMQPLLVGALIDGLRLDAGSAGLLGSIEMAAVALSAFVLAPRLGTVSRRALSLTGAGLAAIGYGASVWQASFAALALCRVVSGSGAGIVLAIGNGAVSACRQPERVYAQMTIAGTIAFTVLLALLPMATTRFAYRGGYGAMALVALALLPLLQWMPEAAASDQGHDDAGATHMGLGVATMGAAALLFFSQSAVWAFAERIATAARMRPAVTGVVLAWSTLAGLGGAALASRIGTAGGRTTPLVTGILLTGVTLLALAYTTTPAAYAVVITFNGVAYLFMVPYVLGVAAALDRQGRWAAAAVGAATIGAALGPGVAGPVVDAGGYDALGWVAFTASVLAAAAVTPVGRGLDRRDRLAAFGAGGGTRAS